MTEMKLLSALSHDGVRYEPGATFEGDSETVADLIRAGVARDPKAEVERNEIASTDAEAKAARLSRQRNSSS
ncbi:hypothetical protein [Williamsia sp. DF01-3]|uniref:DUF7210 family protein n=1 Tax=Williamsia sp. DF01-3 TaxID=2934157 RepID=UPI001FF39CE6|nr:hypothetical protein [Williamsia sp. DF01-3]MCK0519318.1 hypothetical protein [Williamsia sp. DF01-3]